MGAMLSQAVGISTATDTTHRAYRPVNDVVRYVGGALRIFDSMEFFDFADFAVDSQGISCLSLRS